MTSLRSRLSALVGDAFEAAGLARELGAVVRSDRPDLGQFQCNGAMSAAKQAKAPPRQVAERVCALLAADEMLADVSVTGPGFINLTVTDDVLSAHGQAISENPRFGLTERAPKTVILDFGGPNIAKPMHVGHLRSAIIGDSLQRLFKFAGDKTVSDIHMGDWGKPMGMLISELQTVKPDLPYFLSDFDGAYPTGSPVSMEDLEALYPRAAAACKEDSSRDDAARDATAELQKGRRGYRALWRQFVDVSKQGLKREFDALGVRFDFWKGESDVDDLVGPMLADLDSQGVVEKDQGALIVRVAMPEDQHEVPPLIALKSDGAATYATTDLATILDRVRKFRPDLILYVVDHRQHDHFVQVFRAAKIGKIAERADLEHVGFGTINGPDGKPFRTREGGVMKLHDLISMVREAAIERLEKAGLAADYGPEEKETIARQVGIAALKFADLGNHRLSNYVFDLDRFLRFEGKTGPYLQYAAVRIKSILRKADFDDASHASGLIRIKSESERDLVLSLSAFPDAVAGVYDKRAPNILCDHVYALAQSYSRFYNRHHILSESDRMLKQSRLSLCKATLAQIELCLSLLGIDVPARM